MERDMIDPMKPCEKCGGTRKVKIQGIKNGRFYSKIRACSACSPLKKIEAPKP